MTQKLWNVKLSVVGLFFAETGDDAVSMMRASLSAAGFDVYEGEDPHSFESEPVDG